MPDLKTSLREQDPFRFIKRLPWEKITIWAIFLFLIYLLRSFFAVLFLTFVISYIAHNIVDWACYRMGVNHRPNHPLRYVTTVMVFILFLGLIFGAGWLVFPKLYEQGKHLAEQAQTLIPANPTAMTPEDRADTLLRESLGEKEYSVFRESAEYYPLRAEIADTLRKIPGQESSGPPVAREEAIVPRLDLTAPSDTPVTGLQPVKRKDILHHLDNFLMVVMGKARFAEFQASPAYGQTYGQVVKTLQSAATENLPAVADLITTVATKLLGYAMQFLISIIFSFLIVIGIPRFGKQSRPPSSPSAAASGWRSRGRPSSPSSTPP
ncbi:MAG: AI-2E family transporter [Planctomycetota bacterium]|jgi:hypothetical protein